MGARAATPTNENSPSQSGHLDLQETADIHPYPVLPHSHLDESRLATNSKSSP